MPRSIPCRCWTAPAALALLLAWPAHGRDLAAPAAPAGHATYDGTWIALPPPGGRIGASLVYDSHRDRLLMFEAQSGDAWELNLAVAASWQRLAADGAPTVGTWHTAIYDPVRDQVVVFGGYAQSAVWTLSLSGTPAWAALAPQGVGPGPLTSASAIYDPVRDRMVLFAGLDAQAQQLHGETWELSLAGTPAWTLLSPPDADNPGLPRYAHAAAYDSRRDRMLVFGGIQDGLRLSSVWACDFTGGGWQVLATTGYLPTARVAPVAVYDSLADQLVVHGGYDGGYPSDVKALSLAGTPEWSDRLPGPGGRYWAAATFDPVRERLVVFGGRDSTVRGDTWALSLGADPGWTQLAAAAPEPRARASAIYDAPRERLVLFGGSTASAGGSTPYRNDVWALSLGDPPAWGELQPQGEPPTPRFGHSAVFDPVRQRMLVFGGTDMVTFSSDLWELSLTETPTWTPLAVADTSPPGRNSHVAIYDPVRDRMVIAGGFSGPGVGGTLLSDAWALSLDTPVPQWTRLTTTDQPAYGFAEAAGVYDVAGDQLVVAGGRSLYGGGYLTCQALAFGPSPQWNSVGFGWPPPTRLGPVAAYDPFGQRLILFGGCTSRDQITNYVYGETWEMPLSPPGEWRQLSPAGNLPLGRSDAASAFDVTRDQWIVFGGEAGGQSWSDTRALTLRQTVSAPAAASTLLSLAPPSPNPAANEVRLAFTLPAGARVTLDMYDVNGRRVVRLLDAALAGGPHAIAWNGRDALGNVTGPGLYFARLQAGQACVTQRCVRLGGRR